MSCYEAVITNIGSEALTEESLVILFRDNAPEDLREYCILHNGTSVNQPITNSHFLYIGSDSYQICAVGNSVSQNLNDLGHIAIHFSDNPIAANPGDLNVIGTKPNMKVGDTILIKG